MWNQINWKVVDASEAKHAKEVKGGTIKKKSTKKHSVIKNIRLWSCDQIDDGKTVVASRVCIAFKCYKIIFF